MLLPDGEEDKEEPDTRVVAGVIQLSKAYLTPAHSAGLCFSVYVAGGLQGMVTQEQEAWQLLATCTLHSFGYFSGRFKFQGSFYFESFESHLILQTERGKACSQFYGF